MRIKRLYYILPLLLICSSFLLLRALMKKHHQRTFVDVIYASEYHVSNATTEDTTITSVFTSGHAMSTVRSLSESMKFLIAEEKFCQTVKKNISVLIYVQSMKSLHLFFCAIFIAWKQYVYTEELLAYNLILNGEGATFEVKIVENETINIVVHEAGENIGETLIDFNSKYIAIRGFERHCYLFPIPPSIEFNQTDYFFRSLQDKENRSFCAANVSATNPYRIRNASEYGEAIAEWCADKETWGIFSTVSESSGADIKIESHSELSPLCIFVGFIYIFGQEKIACFRTVQTLENMYANKVDFEGGSPDLILTAVCHPNEFPSDQRNKIGYWITSQPGIIYSEEASDSATMLYDAHGFSLYEIGLEGLMNLNANECLLVPIAQKFKLASDLKLITEKMESGLEAESIVCNYRNGQQFYDMVNEIYRIQEFCSYDTVISVKNCELAENHVANDKPCLFKGFLHIFQNHYQAVCIRAIE